MALEALKRLFRTRKRNDGLPLLPRGPLSPGQLRLAYLSTLRNSRHFIEEDMARIMAEWERLKGQLAEVEAAIAKYERKE